MSISSKSAHVKMNNIHKQIKNNFNLKEIENTSNLI